MTKSEYDDMNIDELIDWMYENLPKEITTEDTLLEFAKMKIDDENIPMAIHILKAVYESEESYAGYYLYDYDMGMTQTPKPITDKADFEALIDFED